MNLRKAVFLDKDGTLIPDIPYNVDPDLISLSDEAVAGLQALQGEYLLVVITNQSGVARGISEPSDQEGIRKKLEELLAAHGLRLDGYYFCPHHPEGTIAPYNIDCDCRKPLPGLLLQAAKDLNIDLGASWMVGDLDRDVEAGRLAGCRTILLQRSPDGSDTGATFVAPSLNESARLILSAGTTKTVSEGA